MLTLNGLQTPNTAEFRVIEKEWHNTPVVLINPCVKNPTWEPKNKWFRSSIWDTTTNKALSLGFPKFFNIHENNSKINDISKFTLVEKKDGSLCIVDHIHGQTNSRPRGSFDSSAHVNQQEQEDLLAKYKVEALAKEYPEHSILFEILSPSVQIIIKHKEPSLFLVGMIEKASGRLTTQSQLDELGKAWGIPRPKTWDTQGLTTLQVFDTIKNLEDQEGYCAYDPTGQQIIKLKSRWYLALHAFKSHCTYSELINWFITQWELKVKDPGHATLEYIAEKLNWECVEIARPMIEQINELFAPIAHKLATAKKLAEESKNNSAKEFAELVAQTPHIRSFAFDYFNGKEPKTKQVKNLLQKAVKEKIIKIESLKQIPEEE